MVENFGIAKEKSQISIYAGMVTSAFAFAEFSSGVPWGRLSDKIGRKPVLLTGLAGTALSMILFGFATNLPMALLARALGGLLNGNIGVLQTTVAEMVTVKEHQPRAYTIMPFVWCLGSIIGPSLGGALARPVKNHPTYFAEGTIWDRYPFLLPNLVCTVIVLCGLVVGILFLEETHEAKKLRRDPGLELGKWILSRFSRCARPLRSSEEKGQWEASPLLSEQQQLPGYETTESSPLLAATLPDEPLNAIDVNNVVRRIKPAATKAFTPQVIRNIIGYGILAYHTMTYDSMLPTMLSTEVPKSAALQLPFKFITGYGLDADAIGVIISVQGVYSMIATIFFFPYVVRKLGALNLFRVLAFAYPFLYFTTPYMGLLPEHLKIAGIYFLVIWKCTFMTMAYPSNAILLTNSAPSLFLLGTINGVAASTASLSRAFGPTISGIMFATGQKMGCSGLAWWTSAMIAVLGALVSLTMTDKGGRMDIEQEKEDPEAVVPEQPLEDCALDTTQTESS